MSLAIKSFIAKNGERFSQLYSSDDPWPLFYPTAFIVRSVRRSCTPSTQKVRRLVHVEHAARRRHVGFRYAGKTAALNMEIALDTGPLAVHERSLGCRTNQLAAADRSCIKAQWAEGSRSVQWPWHAGCRDWLRYM